MIGKKGRSSFPISFFAFVCCISALLFFASSSLCAEDEKNLPPRKISIAPEYTGVIIPQGDYVNMDLTVKNGGQQDEIIEVLLPKIPDGWEARIKTYSFDVTSVFVESDSSKSLTFRADPEKGILTGQYVFPIKAKTKDGVFIETSEVTVTVKEKADEKKSEGVNITTSYPVLKGPTDAKFEFSLEVENKTDKDGIFNLASQGPENWEINFKPAYEDKFISSLRIKANQSETMAVVVKPYAMAEPGEYPVAVKVSSEKAKAEVALAVVLTGTYALEVGTSDGLLSLNANQGKEANLSFYVKNTGSATQRAIRFLSFKPENWEVEFSPESLENVVAGDLKQVEVKITPYEQALVGDYSVGINMEGERGFKDLELRVSVKASTAWGWIGIGIIVIVILGLVVLFIRMGRR